MAVVFCDQNGNGRLDANGVSFSSTMKTGRLLKFHRPGGEIHAYIYRDGAAYRAAVYLMTPEGGRRGGPVDTLNGSSETLVEAAVREWVESRFPRPG